MFVLFSHRIDCWTCLWTATSTHTLAQTPVHVALRLRVSRTTMVASQRVAVVAAYNTAAGEPRTAQCEFDVPLALCARVIAPKKSTAVLVRGKQYEPSFGHARFAYCVSNRLIH